MKFTAECVTKARQKEMKRIYEKVKTNANKNYNI